MDANTFHWILAGGFFAYGFAAGGLLFRALGRADRRRDPFAYYNASRAATEERERALEERRENRRAALRDAYALGAAQGRALETRYGKGVSQ